MASSNNIVLTERDTVKRLRHVGRKLPNYLASVDKLLELLDKLEFVLSTLDQDPAKAIKESLVPLMKALISKELLRHTNEGVKISVTACLTEIARITAPEAPYDEEQMKEILKLTVAAFKKLSHVSGRSCVKALAILKNVSKFRIFLIMLDLECDDLIIEMFQYFLTFIRSNHPSNVIDSMEVIMTMILNESEEISPNLLRTLLESVRKENQTISHISWTLGKKVIANCAAKLKPYLMQAVESSGRALDEYAQIVTSICQNQSESPEHIHSLGSSETLVQAVANNLDVHKVADEEPRDVTGGLETDNTCVRDAQIMDDTNVSTNASTMDGEVTKNSGSKRKPHSGLTKNSKGCNAKTGPETGNLESVQELNSETLLDTLPRKRGRKPNSLMNPEEGYDHSWIYMGRSIGKSSRSRKARDSSYALLPSENATSRKDKMQPKRKTIIEALVSEPKNEKIAKPAQSRKTCNIGSGFPYCENPASSKGIVPSNPEDMSKDHEALVAKPKTDENTDAASLTNHNVPDGSCPIISSTGDQDDHPNSVSMLKKSKVRKDSELKPQAPIRKIKLLSIKIGGKEAMPPESVVATMESDFCEDEGKHKSAMHIKVENREEGRSSAEGKKRRRQNTTPNKGLNKSSAMKVHESQDIGGNSLVGKRIKVWWPLDKIFYEGVVYSYDHVKGKNTILYDDGEVERLNLMKQRWELVDANVSPDEEERLGLEKLTEALDTAEKA